MKFFIFLIFLSIAAGCTTMHTTIEYRPAPGHNTATALLDAKPERVFNAALYVLRHDPTAVVLEHNDQHHTIDALKILQNITITITPERKSASRVEIVSNAAATMSRYTDQALGMMQELCNRLGIAYSVPRGEE